MTEDQKQELIKLGVSGVIKKYLPLLRIPQEEGGITREKYDWLLHRVASEVARDTPSVEPETSSTAPHTNRTGESREQDHETAPEDRPTGKNLAAQVSLRDLGSHPIEATGKSQKARLLALLQDREWHDTKEIMAKVYRVNEDRGNCRIPSRICELRQAGHNIETKRITQTLTAYRLV